MPSRRSVLQLTGLGAAAVTVGAAKAVSAPPTAVSAAGGHGHHGSSPTTRPAAAGTRPPIEKFSRPLALLPTAKPVRRTRTTDVYESLIKTVRTEIFPGHPTTVYGYFGSWIPPVIRAQQGRKTAVVQRNRTAVPVSVHLHGGRTAAQFDGQMKAPIAPGDSFTYRYDNDQSAAALWLHDHTHMTDAENVYQGMASPYLIESEEEADLGLPSGAHEIPLLLRDGDFGAKGQFVYTMDDTANRSTILVNGRPWPYLKVKARKYRLRVINGSNMRFFVLGLSTRTKFTQIGGDCGLLEAPFEAPVVALSPGERADVVIDFAAFKPGTNVDLINYVGPGNMDDVGQVMRFTVGDPAPDTSVVPDRLTRLPAVAKPDRTRKFTLVSSEPGVTPMTGTINGRTFDMDRVDFTVPYGSTEEWQIVNANKTVPHNFHAHLAHMRVLTRDGKPVGPEEQGWKDTVSVYPGQTVTARLTFDRHRGVFPVHCHMLDHGAMGMMAQLRVR
jgi:spore coat protein A, manganese oxidase